MPLWRNDHEYRSVTIATFSFLVQFWRCVAGWLSNNFLDAIAERLWRYTINYIHWDNYFCFYVDQYVKRSCCYGRTFRPTGRQAGRQAGIHEHYLLAINYCSILSSHIVLRSIADLCWGSILWYIAYIRIRWSDYVNVWLHDRVTGKAFQVQEVEFTCKIMCKWSTATAGMNTNVCMHMLFVLSDHCINCIAIYTRVFTRNEWPILQLLGNMYLYNNLFYYYISYGQVV